MHSSELFQAFQKLRVAVVGDLMLDHYVWGDTRRISPEAPVPVVDIHRDTYTAGGAANVALNLAALGVGVDLCGMVGKDEAGQRLLDVLGQKGVALSPAFSRPDFQTIVKTRVIVQHQQLCRLDRESPPAQHCLDRNGALSACLEKVRNAGAVIVSDYAKGAITQNLLNLVRAEASKCSVLTALDPKPKRNLDISGFDVITPNRVEALQLASMEDGAYGEPFPAAEVVNRIFEQHHPKSVVITLGGDGMLICRSLEERIHIPTRAREVFDVSGAGDTVVAVLTAGLAAGLSLEDAAHVANVAAGIVVAKLGTAVVTPEELQQKLNAA